MAPKCTPRLWRHESHQRRRHRRVPLLALVRIVGSRTTLAACNISRGGLRTAGSVHYGCVDLHFELPGCPFPLEARAELIHRCGDAAAPLFGWRFVDLEPPYAALLGAYLERWPNRCAGS